MPTPKSGHESGNSVPVWVQLPAFVPGNGGTEIVQVLLDAGANVNEKTDNGRLALLIAEEEGHTGIVEMLKNAGARE